jgi:hypothetical protein
MNSKFDFSTLRQSNIVYIRAVDVADLPDELQEQAQGVMQLYAVCREDGEQLALVADRDMAFVLARQNDFVPVTVH